MVGILAEKPSAAKNMAAALGGISGTYNGEPYVITASHGHLYGLKMPYEQVPDDLKSKYKSWKIENLPWNEADFAWLKQPLPGSSETLARIKKVLSDCDEISIATDDDPSGEGELLGWEIISGLGLENKKISRMYFEDEQEKNIRKAFISRMTLSRKELDNDYNKALYREKWDYLSMQWTRIARVAGDGHSIIREGRLKSYMVWKVGEQLKAIKAYKKVPYYQNRFVDENKVVYNDQNEPKYQSQRDVPDIYEESQVIVDSVTQKKASPRRLLDLSSLGSILAPKGLSSAQFLSLYQKMYEAKIVSYPRTEDKLITIEQYRELLPLVDRIAEVTGVDPTLLTHRMPRPTHIGKNMTHGANRPGPVVPKSLEDLDRTFGKYASDIYMILAKNYLAIMAEDYEYESQKGHLEKYPSFKGTATVPKKAGWKAVFSNEDDKAEDESTKGLGKNAKPFTFEGAPKKPTRPTMKWLMKDLEKNDIGTGATRTSTYAEVTKPESEKNKYPLLIDKKGVISMTRYGDISYTLLPGTHIGSLKITSDVMEEAKLVSTGAVQADTYLHKIQQYVIDDIATMTANGKDILKEEKKEPARETFTGEWNGRKFKSFRYLFGNAYRLTDEDIERLQRGETITIYTNLYGDPYEITGALGINTSRSGKKYVGFVTQESRNLNPLKENAYGIWNGEKIHFKRIYDSYRLTDPEVENLCANKKTIIRYSRKKTGDIIEAEIRLAKAAFNSHPYVKIETVSSLNRTHPETENVTYVEGDWQKSRRIKKHIRLKTTWGTHAFTEQEIKDLLDGKEISFEYKRMFGTEKITGKIKEYTYNGNKITGFRKIRKKSE